jgi:hypothetical protein
LVPEHLAAANVTPFNVTVKTWLRKANTAARIRRGPHLIQPVDRAALFAEATRNLENWTAAEFLDIGRAVRRFAMCHAQTAPQAVAERVAHEISWLISLDVSALGQV